MAAMPAVMLLIFVMQGCKASYKEPNLLETKITSFKMDGLTSARFGVDATIENPNNFSFKIMGLKGLVLKGKEELAYFSSSDELEIPKLSTQTYSFEVVVHVTNFQEALEIVSNASNIDYKQFTADVTANIKKAGITIPVKREGVPLSKFLKDGFSLDKLF